MPKISIIIPVYNVEKYLAQCLDSVINQTLKDIEIICINDGSTDGSLKILRDYAKKDDRIKVINQDNSGVSVARNKGIKSAKGEFICFVDADDLYPNIDILEILYLNAVKNNVLISGGELYRFDNHTQSYQRPTDKEFIFDKEGIMYYKDYQFSYGFTRFIYNRKFLLDNNLFFPNYTHYEDPVFLVRAMYLAEKFYAIKKCCYAYRYNHKPFVVTQTIAQNAFLGILDNLKFAKQFKLDILTAQTLKNFEYFNKETKNSQDLSTKKLSKSIKLFYPFSYFFQEIFSFKNSSDKKHKIITIFGLKLKFKRKKKNFQKKFSKTTIKH